MKIVNPLAQSFYIDPATGIFATSIDVYFYSKDIQLPVTLQLRPIKLGLPTDKVYPDSEVTLYPEDISISDDASVPTRFVFDNPIYLTGKTFHSIVLLSNSEEYNVWVSRLGELDVTTYNAQNSRELIVTKQPDSGSLFMSQSGSTWTENQYDDLKYTLYRANFTNLDGNVSFYNSELNESNRQISTLLKDSLEFNSRKIKVGLSNTVTDSNLILGNTIIQSSTGSNGNYVGYAGSAYGDLKIIDYGSGYTDGYYSDISLVNIISEGYNGTANITISGGKIVSLGATINNGGYGYKVGDVVTIQNLGTGNLGRNIKLSISNISGVNQIIIDQVQGNFITGIGNTIGYVNNVGVSTDLNGAGSNVLASFIEEINNGISIKVNHKNHGMHSTNNYVKIYGVASDINPTKLRSAYINSQSTDILVDSTTGFETFEGIQVSVTNPGYVLIGSEIIAYTGYTADTLTGTITREIDQTLKSSYPLSTNVYKYELNGISLRRINTTHMVKNPIGLDYYTIEIDTSQAGKTEPLPYGQVDRSTGVLTKLFIKETKSSGGSNVKASQNIQFEIIEPIVQTLNLTGTDIKTYVRTVSGTSINGNENSFEDNGFSEINLNTKNYFNSPRIISSKINEENNLSNFIGNKSLTLNLALSSTNNYISPIIDLERTAVVLTTNRIDSPITDYILDDRASSTKNDPSSFVYITNPIILENPATSIKIILSAYVNVYSDLRAFYATSISSSDDLIYYPFPGYKNLTSDKNVIDISLSDGTSDSKMNKTTVLDYKSKKLPFVDYEFTINNISQFNNFSIKLIGTSTNQCFPPRIKDLRVIALA
jgi:hypothetical protein